MSQPPHRFTGPGNLDRALDLVRFLRRNCPWDAEQTAESLVPHLLEETHEVVDAIQAGHHADLEGELGDLLLNLAFQVVVAEEGGLMDADSVYRRLESKMVRRHPHLFGDGERRSWEALKAEERGGGSVLEGLARGLDPLTKAFRIQERVASVGFDWDDDEGPLSKVEEEVKEVRGASALGDTESLVEELGDLLFSVVNVSRRLGVHPTTALSRANRKFEGRFRRLEQIAAQRDIDLGTAGLARLDELWDEVKQDDAEG